MKILFVIGLIQLYCSLIKNKKLVDAFNQRRFAASVFTEQAYNFTRLDFKIDPVQNLFVIKLFLKIAYFQKHEQNSPSRAQKFRSENTQAFPDQRSDSDRAISLFRSGLF